MSNNIKALAVISAILLMYIPPATIAEPVGVTEGNSSNKNTQTNASENVLEDVREKIEKAIYYYNEGDLDASKHNLEIAIMSLNKAAKDSMAEKSRDESRKLSLKIDEFKKTLNSTSVQHENDLSRYWHQAVSIIKRETDHLIHSYNKLSVSEKTLKYLLDAKLHLFMAKHDLLVVHDDEASITELNSVLEYLDEANQVAKPSIKIKITQLSENIHGLIKLVHPGNEEWKNNDITLSLKQAAEKLIVAKNIASPHVKSRIELLEADIQLIQTDVERDNIKHDYEQSIVKLKKIIHEL